MSCVTDLIKANEAGMNKMQKELKFNEPAFPSGFVEDENEQVSALHNGLSVRDYFAAKALQGLLSKHGMPRFSSEFAEGAYQIADAMLQERIK